MRNDITGLGGASARLSYLVTCNAFRLLPSLFTGTGNSFAGFRAAHTR